MKPSILSAAELDKIRAEALAATDFPLWIKIGAAALAAFEVIVILGALR